MGIKRILSVLLIVFIFISITTFSLAVDTNFYEPDAMSQEDSDKTGEITGDILASVRAIGIIIAVVILTIIGLKYIFSSIEEKAEYKQTILPYVIGCFLLASATTIPSIVYDLAVKDGTTISAPIISGITWDGAADASKYIGNGGDLSEVSDDELLNWYGQLSRLASNNGINVDEYDKVKEEVNRRGGYNELQKKVNNIGGDKDGEGDGATSASEYIGNGGDLSKVPDDELLNWYGQLSRLASNNGINVDEYNKVKEEVEKRGGYNALQEKVNNIGGDKDGEGDGSSSNRTHGGGGRTF